MNQCQRKTVRGTRCRNHCPKGERHCGRHRGVDLKRTGMAATGAMIGTMMEPGIGTVVGGGLGWLIDKLGLSARNTKSVFVSFDYSHDVRQKNLFVGQANHGKTPWTITNSSLLEAAPEDEWEGRASEAIAESDLVVVLLGPHTWRAHGVLKEVRFAKRHGVPVVQIASERNWGVPGVPGAGRRYPWSWPHLERVMG